MGRFSEEDAINKCKELDLIYIGFHKEKKKGTIVEFICPKHQNKGVQYSDWSHFHKSTVGCPYCTGRYRTTEEFEDLAKDLDIEAMSPYLGNEKPIDLRCKKCGHIWTTKPKVQLTNNSACPICGRQKANLNEMKTREKFISELSLINPFVDVIGEYLGTHRWIECRCRICNKSFSGMPSRLLRGEAGCPFCNLSDGERKLLLNLDSLNISYVRQYSIDDCKYINKLRFDAFNTIYNIAFEYNGEQHYYPISFGSQQSAEEEFQITQERDNAKIEYCKQKNIPLIIVPYWEKDNMYDYLSNEINNRRLNYITNNS